MTSTVCTNLQSEFDLTVEERFATSVEVQTKKPKTSQNQGRDAAYVESLASQSIIAMEETLDRYQLSTGTNVRGLHLFHFTNLEAFRTLVERSIVLYHAALQNKMEQGNGERHLELNTFLDSVLIRYLDENRKDEPSSRCSSYASSKCQFSPIKPHIGRQHQPSLSERNKISRMDLSIDFNNSSSESQSESPCQEAADEEVKMILFANANPLFSYSWRF